MKINVLSEDLDINRAIDKIKGKLRNGVGLRTSIYITLREMGVTEEASQKQLLAKLEAEIRRRASMARRRASAKKRMEKQQTVPDWFFT